MVSGSIGGSIWRSTPMDFWQPGQPLAKGRYTIASAPRVSGDRTTVTYMATDNQTRERVAIETPNPDIHDAPKLAKIQSRFVQEAQKLTKCSGHSHIIGVRGFLFDEGGLYCLPLEYLAGVTLADLESVCLEESKALEYVRQIGEALTVVHQNNLVHGDVRPENLHLRIGSNEAVLTEFSLTREVGSGWTTEYSHSARSKTDWKDFAAPEAIKDEEKPTPRSDLYMLGGTLYYLLTGRAPVGAIERLNGNALEFTRVTDGGRLSGNVRDAIASAMELKEEKRPESVRAWLVSLGFEVSEATGAVQKLSQEDLNYQEAQLKIRAQELEIKSKQWALAVTVITGMVGVIGWGVSKLQPTQPTNEPASQTQQEAK